MHSSFLTAAIVQRGSVIAFREKRKLSFAIMAASREGFSAEAVASFIREKGNKATTAEVARHFRKFLLDEDNQGKLLYAYYAG